MSGYSICFTTDIDGFGVLFEGDNLAKFIIEMDNKANKLEGQVIEPPKEWNGFVKSTLIGIKDAKYEEQISIASDIFIDAYTGKIEACTVCMYNFLWKVGLYREEIAQWRGYQ